MTDRPIEPLDDASLPPRRLVGWAWACVAFVPFGFLLSFVVLFGFADLLDVVLLPTEGSVRVSASTGLLLGTVSVLVALAAPTAAIILGSRASRAGERTAKAARDLAAALLLLVALTFTLGVGTFGLLGILLVAVVLVVALRRPRVE